MDWIAASEAVIVSVIVRGVLAPLSYRETPETSKLARFMHDVRFTLHSGSLAQDSYHACQVARSLKYSDSEEEMGNASDE